MTLYDSITATRAALAEAFQDMRVDNLQTRVYEYDPQNTDTLPAIIISLPEARRQALEEDDSQLGRTDLFLTFPVTVVLRWGSPQETSAIALKTVSAIDTAIEADYTLDDTAYYARMTSWDW